VARCQGNPYPAEAQHAVRVDTRAPAFACGLQRARTKLARRLHFAEQQMMTDGFWLRKREREKSTMLLHQSADSLLRAAGD
jgi:hypothetical protein